MENLKEGLHRFEQRKNRVYHAWWA